MEAFYLVNADLVDKLHQFVLAAWRLGVDVELLIAHHDWARAENHHIVLEAVGKARDLFVEMESADGVINEPMPHTHCKRIDWPTISPATAPTAPSTSDTAASAPTAAPTAGLPAASTSGARTIDIQGTIIVSGAGTHQEVNQQDSVLQALIQTLAQISRVPTSQIMVTPRQQNSDLKFQFQIRCDNDFEAASTRTAISSISSNGLLGALLANLEQEGYSGPNPTNVVLEGEMVPTPAPGTNDSAYSEHGTKSVWTEAVVVWRIMAVAVVAGITVVGLVAWLKMRKGKPKIVPCATQSGAEDMRKDQFDNLNEIQITRNQVVGVKLDSSESGSFSPASPICISEYEWKIRSKRIVSNLDDGL